MRDTNRQAYTDTDRQTDRVRDTNRQACRHRQTDRQGERWTDRHAGTERRVGETDLFLTSQ